MRRSSTRWAIKAAILICLSTYCGCATSARAPADHGLVNSDDEDSGDEASPPPKQSSLGTVPFRKVDIAISAHWDEVRDCYLKISKPGMADKEGAIDTEITIGKNGKALDARIVNSTLQSPEVEACILDLIRRIDDFPTPDGGDQANASYSFYFSRPAR